MQKDSHQTPQLDHTTEESTPSPGRVGEYNPESILEDLSSVTEASPTTEHFRPCPTPTHSRAAQALARHPDEQAAVAAQRAQRQSLWYKTYRRRIKLPTLSESHQRYLRDEGAFLELPRTTTNALLSLYVTSLNDLLPLLDGASLLRDHSNGQSSIYLVRAVCLVTCKAKPAAPFLRLTDDGPLLHPLQFASKLLSGLDASIKADLEPDRLIKIQILALMHLHNDGLLGTVRSSRYLSHAISEAWALDLHYNILGNSDQQQCDYLWWSLRNLDRLNKPVMATGPFMIDDTDISIKRISPRKECYRSQVMGVSLALGDLMARATKVYKASSTSTEDDSFRFPALSELTLGTDFERFHRSHREYLEIWYHVAAMLSCRYSGPGSVQYNRRLASADQVLDIVSRKDHEGLPAFPLVPYSMSISTCVIYRALRDETRDLETAYKDLQRCCEALDFLSKQWTSTKSVSKLAKRLWSIPRPTTPHGNSGHDNRCERSRVQRRERSIIAENSSDNAYPSAANPNGMVTPMPAPSQVGDQHVPLEQIPYNYHNFMAQPIDALEGGSFFQLDMAFHDLFDYSLPNAFRNTVTWEDFNVAEGM